MNMEFCGRRPLQFIVARGQNTYEITDRLFAAEGRHSLLWPAATTFLESQRAYLQPEAAIYSCGQRPQHSCRLKEPSVPGKPGTNGHYQKIKTISCSYVLQKQLIPIGLICSIPVCRQHTGKFSTKLIMSDLTCQFMTPCMQHLLHSINTHIIKLSKIT